jgi:hypothetical protein
MFLHAVAKSGIRARALWRNSWRSFAAAAAAGALMVLLLPAADGFVRTAALGSVGLLVYGVVLIPANPLVAWTARQVRPRPAGRDVRRGDQQAEAAEPYSSGKAETGNPFRPSLGLDPPVLADGRAR